MKGELEPYTKDRVCSTYTPEDALDEPAALEARALVADAAALSRSRYLRNWDCERSTD